MRTAVRLTIALASLTAALAPVTAALAFSKVDKLDPVPPGHSYVYYVREVDNNRNALAGRTVTMKLQNAPGPGAAVAAADATGHATGPEGQGATEASGHEGLAYFLLRTSTTPGVNEFVWDDGTYTGQVLVTGLGAGGATPSPTATPKAAHGGGGAANVGGGPSAAALRGRLPATRMPPIAAGIVAAGLVWLVVPWLLRRRAGGVSPAVRAQPSRLPSGSTGLG